MNLRRKAAVYTVLAVVALAASFAFGYQLPSPQVRAAKPDKPLVGNGSPLSLVTSAFTGRPLAVREPCPFPGYHGLLYVATPPPAHDPGSWFVLVCMRDVSVPPSS